MFLCEKGTAFGHRRVTAKTTEATTRDIKHNNVTGNFNRLSLRGPCHLEASSSKTSFAQTLFFLLRLYYLPLPTPFADLDEPDFIVVVRLTP